MQNQADSLRSVLKTTSNDSLKVKVLLSLYQGSDSITYAKQALKIAERIGYKPGISHSLLDIGRFYYFGAKPDSALGNLIKAMKIAEELGEKKILINAYRYIGYIYRPDDPFISEVYYYKSLKMAREIGDELSESYALSALGNIYEDAYAGNTENNRKALSYYLQSLQIRERIGSDEEIASSLNETSRIYALLGQYDKEMALRLKGLELAKKAGSIENMAFLSNVLGDEYSYRLHNYKIGLQYHLAAYHDAKKLNNAPEILFSATREVAHDYYLLGDVMKSNFFYQQAMVFNDSIHALQIKHVYNLSGLKHDLEKELDRQKLLLKNTEISKEKAEAGRQAIFRNAELVIFAFILILAIIVFRGYRLKKKSNQELAVKNTKLEAAYQVLAQSEQKFKLITETIDDVFYLFNILEKKYEYISQNCITLLGLSQEWVYEHNSIKSPVLTEDLPKVIDANIKIDSGLAYDIEYRVVVNNKIKWVAEKSSPIYDEKGNLVRNSGICRDITQRKENEGIIETKNKDIRDSILYARTIQNAILVPKEKIIKKIKDFFILSKPKDIVSGDFYFYRETENGLIVAVADCTGHGVPGGFMSMLGSAYLNEILNNNRVITPAQILDELRERVITSLNQNTTYTSNKDGMDISLLSFENNSLFIEYAGAYNPMYIIRNGDLNEVNADKFPIGIHLDSKKYHFTNNQMALQKGDAVYLFSDGYTDQFGGHQSKKFTKTKFKELLLSIYDKKMDEQEKILDQTFEDWKGSQVQIDDVMVMGIRI